MNPFPEHALLFLSAAFAAEIIESVIGFGSALLLVPLAALFLPVPEAIVLSGLFHLFGSLSRSVLSMRFIRWPTVVRFGLPAAIAAPIGAFLLPAFDASDLQLILGITLLLYAVFSLFHHRIRFETSSVLMSVAGAVSGFVAGLLGTTGLIQAAVLSALSVKNRTYLATVAAVALVTDVPRVMVYHITGQLNTTGWFTVSLLTVAIAGAILGGRIVKRVTGRAERRSIFVALLLAGVYFIITKM